MSDPEHDSFGLIEVDDQLCHEIINEKLDFLISAVTALPYVVFSVSALNGNKHMNEYRSRIKEAKDLYEKQSAHSLKQFNERRENAGKEIQL